MGLTLIELMVAMALLGVVGVLTWRATSQLVDARERIGAELSRWQAVVHASALIERELMQIAPPELA
ncbi:MAG: prepilin-type N-terminal cleavage/methylation domain-containing protein, partial [Thauera sp.]|nr:prepilin-type N-terminal cleavage/methylation domain-containing protein [Thauera sp.]